LQKSLRRAQYICYLLHERLVHLPGTCVPIHINFAFIVLLDIFFIFFRILNFLFFYKFLILFICTNLWFEVFVCSCLCKVPFVLGGQYLRNTYL